MSDTRTITFTDVPHDMIAARRHAPLGRIVAYAPNPDEIADRVRSA